MGNTLDLRPLAACLAALLFWIAPAAGSEAGAAGDGLIAADAAFQGAEAGNMTVIDVRSPGEWRQTGIPQGARAVTIHDPGGIKGFVDAMTRAVGGRLDAPVALICARGGRSTRAQQALRSAGFTRVMNIREGMLGSSYGPGWLERGLPLEALSSGNQGGL